MNKELRIDKSRFAGGQEDVEALKIAIERLTTASQEQFEQIKMKNGICVSLIWLHFLKRAKSVWQSR